MNSVRDYNGPTGDIDRGEVTVVDPLSIDLTGHIKPYWDDAVRYFREWQSEHPEADYEDGVVAWWDCEKRARHKFYRSQRVRVECPTCHGKGTVLRAPQ